MTQTRIDQLRAAFMVVVSNIVTALVLFSIVDWSGEQVAAITAAVNSGTIMLALIFRNTPPAAP